MSRVLGPCPFSNYYKLWQKFIINCDRYYKVWQLLQSVTNNTKCGKNCKVPQIVIINCDNYYKGSRNNAAITLFLESNCSTSGTLTKKKWRKTWNRENVYLDFLVLNDFSLEENYTKMQITDWGLLQMTTQLNSICHWGEGEIPPPL